jgi:hypothetical protein
MPPALKPLAFSPPPPADALPLAAAVTERWIAPAVSGRLFARNSDPGLPAFSLRLRTPAPASGEADEAWKRIPVAAPVERAVVARAVSDCLLTRQPEPELPAFALALRVPAPVRRPADEAWKRIAAAMPVERILTPHRAALVDFSVGSAVQPTLGCLALADPASASAPDVRHVIPQPQKGEPALSAAGPVSSVLIAVPAAHQPEYCGYFPNGPEPEAPALPQAVSARSMATPVSGRAPASPPLRLPRFGGSPMPNQGLPSAPFLDSAAHAAEETAMPRQIEQAPVSTVTVRLPQSPEPVKFAALALSELMPLEYFCSRGPRVHPHGVGWIVPVLAATAPRFTAPLIIERFEPLPAERTKPAKRPGFAEIFTLPEAASMRSHKVREWSKIIAACLVIGAMLWYGTSFLRSDHDSGAGPSLLADDSTALHANPAVERQSGGIFHRIRASIAGRAEVHLNDGFNNGMAAWGASPKTLASGWARHPEGYVTPGDLALYRPTLRYTDYRLEFFGQIESKSLDWAVRATDDANYYAMKFASDGPGPRAVVSMIHYPVVAGRKGPRVVTPLNVMIHEHTPYHVEVDVQGDRVTTSIEGEEVDSFVDGTLARGGVGFFADAGEQARLYWIKVSRNEDWLGRVCAFLSGGNSSTAQLWLPAGNSPRPDSGDPMPSNHLVLAAGFGLLRRNALGRISYHRRFSSWRS